MRTFETVYILILIWSIIILFLRRFNRKRFIRILLLLFFTFFLQIVIEKFRWQMVPAYGLSTTVILLGFYIIIKRDRRFNNPYIFGKLSKSYKTIIILLLVAGVSILPVILPVIHLPFPSGPYKIGTKYLELVDPSRKEIYAADSTQNRELPVQVWYPANPDVNAQPEPYLQDPGMISTAVTRSQGIPFLPFLLNHLNLIKTNSFPDAQIVSHAQTFPVILFSHGMNQFYKFNTALIEEIVSHGYVVFSISHPYDTPAAVYPDGSIRIYKKRSDSFPEQQINEQEINLKLKNIYEQIQKTKDVNRQRLLYKEFYALQPEDWRMSNEIWFKDTRFVMDNLDSLNSAIFAGKLNVNKTGVMGFSFGGGIAGLMAMTNDRVKAGINLDGWQPGHTLESNIKCPFMYMCSDGHENSFEFFMKNADTTVYRLNFLKFKHPNFNDMSLIAELPARLLGVSGDTDSKAGLRTVTLYSVAFFDLYLKNKHSELLHSGLNLLPDIEIKIANQEK